MTRPIATFIKHAGALNLVAFSPDGERIIAGGYDKIAKVWNVRKPAAPAIELVGHSSWILAAAFSPDGRSVATASADGTVKVWPLQPGGADSDPYTFAIGAGQFSLLTFTRDGGRLIEAGYDRTMRIFELRPNAVLGLALTRISRPFTTADCSGQEDPGRCRALLPIVNGIAEGNRLARSGKAGEARARYRAVLGKGIGVRADDLINEIDSENKNNARHLDVNARIALAEALAIAGDVASSRQLLDQAVKARSVSGDLPDFDPQKVSDPEFKRHLYLQLASVVVRTSDRDALVEGYFKRSLKPNTAPQDAIRSLRQFMLGDLLYLARNELNKKNMEQSLHHYARAAKYTDDQRQVPETDPFFLNNLCWRGNLQKLNADPFIKQACDLAVRLTESKNSSNLDSRGLNRAMNNDFGGAIADFQAYANDASRPDASRKRRLEWIAILKDARSPFDDVLLKQLREEDTIVIAVSPPAY